MKKFKNILVAIALILLYLFFSSIPITFLYIIGIDYNSWNEVFKIIYMLMCNIVIIAIVCGIYYKTLKNDFKTFFNRNILNNLENSFKYWLLGFIVMIISNLILSFITNGIAGNEESVRELIGKFPIYMAFDVCIYAPLIEELIFRKSIRDITDKKWIYVLLSGLVFGGLHVVGSVTSPVDLLYLIPYSSLGIAFAYSYYKNNNIFSTISMHVMHNTMSFIILIIAGLS